MENKKPEVPLRDALKIIRDEAAKELAKENEKKEKK